MRRILSAAMVLVLLLTFSGCDAFGLAEEGEAWTQKAESAWDSLEAELAIYGYRPSDEVREAFRDAAEYTGDSAKAYLQGEGSFLKATATLIGEAGDVTEGLRTEIAAAAKEHPGDREGFSEAVDSILLDRLEAYKEAVSEAYMEEG
ncbi:MAG TPA: hypothetical protein PKY19_03370 [Oscillospiraceae bacterium]|nr:hypothetical protein [Oscillospiraceae bacterium]HXK77507.1 hypothetical protein [Oscillospiraceae bacterium]